MSRKESPRTDVGFVWVDSAMSCMALARAKLFVNVIFVVNQHLVVKVEQMAPMVLRIQGVGPVPMHPVLYGMVGVVGDPEVGDRRCGGAGPLDKYHLHWFSNQIDTRRTG